MKKLTSGKDPGVRMSQNGRKKTQSIPVGKIENFGYLMAFPYVNYLPMVQWKKRPKTNFPCFSLQRKLKRTTFLTR